MRIAIFHNYMDNIGGAELVTLILARELDADIYTTVYSRENIKKLGFDPRIRSIGWVPKNAPFRQQLTAFRFWLLNLGKKYDFYIISGDWAVAAARRNKPNFWIIYSPPRELWDLYAFTRLHTVPWWARPLFDVWVHLNRSLTKHVLKHISQKAAISKNVQQRVRDYLREAVPILYPPTDTKTFRYNKNGDFWLSVNRLITHKRIELQLEAFRGMPDKKLVIVGSYEQSSHFKQYASRILSSLPPNVEVRSWIPADELRQLYADCRGLIATSLNEDYGMNVVEAMASGKPVIAPNEGGFKETIIPDETGILLNDISPEKIADAVRMLDKNPEAMRTACERQAARFDTSVFIKHLQKMIADTQGIDIIKRT